MGFYPDVQPGQKYSPSAALENDVRHYFNALNGFTVPAGAKSRENQLKVYNSTDKRLASGSIVAPAEKGAVIEGAVPVRPYKAGDKLFGIVSQDVMPTEFGSCIISGAAEVAVSGTGATAAPASDGKSFVAGSGTTPLLYSFEGRGVVLLGASGVPEYYGYHKISITPPQESNEKAMVKVCDGRTGGESLVYVNGKFFALPSFSAELLYSMNYIFIYIALADQNLTARYVVLSEPPNTPAVKTSEYFLIGRVEKSENGSWIIYQDFTNTSPTTYSTANGVPQIWYRTTRY